MAEKKYMSGGQLRQYLHISTRKMKNSHVKIIAMVLAIAFPLVP